MKFLKNIICIILVFSISYTLSSAENIHSDKQDLDYNSNKEYVKVYFRNNKNPFSIQVLNEKNVAISNNLLLGEPQGVYLGIETIDINPKDKQKEIILSRLVSKNSSVICRLDLFVFSNNTIKKIAHFYANPSPSYDGYKYRYSIDSKNSIFSVLSLDNSPFFYNYYEKYKFHNNTFKKITSSEVNVSFFGEQPLNYILPKDVTSYSNDSLTKKSTILKQEEYITILCVNKDKGYIKVKNKDNNICYIPAKKEIYELNKEDTKNTKNSYSEF